VERHQFHRRRGGPAPGAWPGRCEACSVDMALRKVLRPGMRTSAFQRPDRTPRQPATTQFGDL